MKSRIITKEEAAFLEKQEQDVSLRDDEVATISDVNNKIRMYKSCAYFIGMLGLGVIAILLGFFLFSGIISAGIIIGGLFSVFTGYVWHVLYMSMLMKLLVALGILILLIGLSMLMTSHRS